MNKELKQEIKNAKKDIKRCKKQYPDWKDDEYNCGPLKYVWGIQSNGQDATNFYQLNDLDIYYNRDTNKYMLGVETLYIFDSNKDKALYLKRMEEKFSSYIDAELDNKYDPFNLYMYNDGNLFQADSMTELYYKFKIFVNGYQSLCEVI